MSIHLTVRMAAPSIIISLLLLTVGCVGGWYIQRIQRSAAKTVSLDMATIQAAEQVVFSITQTRMELAQFLATRDPTHLQAVPAACNQIEHSLAETEELADDDDEKALTLQIRAGYEGFLAAWKQVSVATPTDKTRQAVTRMNNELTAEKLLAPAKELLSLEERLIQKSSYRNQDVAGRVAVFLWLLGICGAAAGLFAGFGIAVGISQSIVNLYVPIRAASGRLEEVIGPVNVAPAAAWQLSPGKSNKRTGIAHLDEILRIMADHVGTVVDRLQHTEHEVLRAEQMSALGQLAAGMAHELRNPLTSLKLLVQAAVESGPDTGLRGHDLTVVADETARLDRLLQTFLDFARPPKLQMRRADVRQVLHQTLELISSRANSQGVAICAADILGNENGPPQPLLIDADHELLRQVFLNLMLNALDAQPQGGAVRVTAACKDGFTLTVADDGPGICPELADQIFEPYISTKDTGLGLGLAISHRIVDAHGGQISAAPGPAGGTVFTVRIPAQCPPLVNASPETRPSGQELPCKAS